MPRTPGTPRTPRLKKKSLFFLVRITKVVGVDVHFFFFPITHRWKVKQSMFFESYGQWRTINPVVIVHCNSSLLLHSLTHTHVPSCGHALSLIHTVFYTHKSLSSWIASVEHKEQTVRNGCNKKKAPSHLPPMKSWTVTNSTMILSSLPSTPSSTTAM